MRIVTADDSAIVRAGLAEILTDSNHEVAATVGNADDLQPPWPSTIRTLTPGNATCSR